jgi:hypothetical protein
MFEWPEMPANRHHELRSGILLAEFNREQLGLLALASVFTVASIFTLQDLKSYEPWPVAIANAAIIAVAISAPLAAGALWIRGALRYLQAIALVPAGFAVGFVMLDYGWIAGALSLAIHICLAWRIAYQRRGPK